MNIAIIGAGNVGVPSPPRLAGPVTTWSRLA